MRNYIVIGLVIVNLVLSGLYLSQSYRVKDFDKKLDSEYVKGFNAALDCRSTLSAPLCEELLKRTGDK